MTPTALWDHSSAIVTGQVGWWWPIRPLTHRTGREASPPCPIVNLLLPNGDVVLHVRLNEYGSVEKTGRETVRKAK